MGKRGGTVEDHSVMAYLERLPKEKAEVVLLEWMDENKRPDYVTNEMLELLHKKVEARYP